LTSLLKGSVSSKRAALTAVARSSGVEGPRLLCAITVRQKRRQNTEVKSMRATPVISNSFQLCDRASKFGNVEGALIPQRISLLHQISQLLERCIEAIGSCSGLLLWFFFDRRFGARRR